MSDRNDFGKLPGETNCSISEERFPVMRKCCIFNGVGVLQRYQCICPVLQGVDFASHRRKP